MEQDLLKQILKLIKELESLKHRIREFEIRELRIKILHVEYVKRVSGIEIENIAQLRKKLENLLLEQK